jgi:hypoxanthine phosphoribosyltransferase
VRDLYVSWDEYHRLVERLTVQIYEDGYQFDAILCLARGGLRVGDVISRVYDMPLAILAASSYREAAGMQQGTLDISEYITKTGGEIAGKVLLVDDLVDSGVTMARVIEHLKQRFSRISDVRTAVLWYKSVSTFRPDYFVEYLEDSPWIHQPFEEYDALRPIQLAARLRGRAQAH